MAQGGLPEGATASAQMETLFQQIVAKLDGQTR
jgi:hypothetical protein